MIRLGWLILHQGSLAVLVLFAFSKTVAQRSRAYVTRPDASAHGTAIVLIPTDDWIRGTRQ